MPAISQKSFSKLGHQLYDSDEQVSALLSGASFVGIRHVIKGDPEAAEGRLTIANV
ncbi:MAG: hypothetical protein ACR2FO_05435 [Actinomycetota bacterium]